MESAHMGHPDFRVNGRIFATLQANMESGAVMLAPEEQQEFLRTHPKTFTPASGAWGRQGSTMVRLAGAEPAAVRSAILMAWQRALDAACSQASELASPPLENRPLARSGSAPRPRSAKKRSSAQARMMINSKYFDRTAVVWAAAIAAIVMSTSAAARRARRKDAAASR